MAAFAEGVPCWTDAMLPDVEAGKRFYGELFGWTFDEGVGDAYGYSTPAYSEGLGVATLAPKKDGRMPTVWTVYLATPDAFALAGRIREAGGTLVSEPRPVGPFGTMALAADPEGAVFGLWQGGTHTGFEKRGERGSFCRAEVYSHDPATVDPFYERVFGYAVADLPDLPDPPGPRDSSGLPDPPGPPGPPAGQSGYRAWSPAGEKPGPGTAIGGRGLVAGTYPAEMPAHFVVCFGVADCDAAAASVERLGGRIQVPPAERPYGRTVLVADDQGAHFALLQDPES